jgi:hypothetical protein
MRPLPQSSRRETSSCAALARQTGTSQQAGHSSVGRASDCRALQQSDGPWFDSGWPDGMTNPLAGACVLKTDASAARRARSPRPRPSCREGDRRLGRCRRQGGHPTESDVLLADRPRRHATPRGVSGSCRLPATAWRGSGVAAAAVPGGRLGAGEWAGRAGERKR